MFMGEYNHTIDTKGRMIIPAKIREQLGDLCIVTKGLDNCLAIYTEEAWKKISTALQSHPMRAPAMATTARRSCRRWR